MDGDLLLISLRTLIELDHHDRARTAAALVPDTVDMVDLIRAADGVQRLARAVDVQRRVQASAREAAPNERPPSRYA